MVAARGSYKFFLEHKMKPDTKKYFDNIDDYTVEEIENSGLQKWIRTNLIHHKLHRHAENDALKFAYQMMNDQVEDKKYKVFVYVGMSKFIGDNGKGFQIEINEGDHIMEMEDNQVFIDNTVKTINNITALSISFVGEMTKPEYFLYLKNKRMKKYNIQDDVPSNKITSGHFRGLSDFSSGEVLSSDRSITTNSGFPIQIRKI